MELSIGDELPDITLADQDGAWIKLRDFANQPVVVFFYPKDNTPVCNIEACEFEAHYNDLKNAGVKVFGISKDSVSSHKKFATRFHLEYRLLSDVKGEAEQKFGVGRKLFGLLQNRVTFIFGKGGKLIHTIHAQFNGRRHVDETLSVLNIETGSH
ncbi:peroxiredoxin Q/BCP [Reichenbachiella faecimaris]|uniref:thioredoxin-dependent peroxiredoxin n=1 Tax=Reichenbachiella faecimaris TaxID=692418 RepID=A0A1W2G8M0_REIFA|nr:peroxiredoxin [Reichenbachiella faecimaris]SMD32678.1 peroxiredoxin Q/BCP [Reichenbachiella faecimaris]